MNKLNRSFFQRFWAIAKLYWYSKEKWGAIALLLTLIASILVSANLTVLANTKQGKVLSVIAAQDGNQFWAITWKLTGLYLMIWAIWAAHNYIRQKLGLYWRRWLSKHFFSQYFRNRAFYELSQSQREIDNLLPKLSV